MKDFAVVGSGVGGSSIAAYLSHKGYEVALFEKEPYLGGCSSTFSKKGYHYNTGATTLAGYQEGHLVKEFLDELGIKPDVKVCDPSIVIVQNNTSVPRYTDLEQFLQALQSLHPHPKNREFWSLVHRLGKEFYAQRGYAYSNRSFFAKLRSLVSYIPLFGRFYRYLFCDARSFIVDFFGDISDEYLDFLDAQILIVAQAKTPDINFFTAALSLGYTFNENHYVMGGFDSLFELLGAKVKEVHKNRTIDNIQRKNGFYILKSGDKEFKAKNVILNSTIYESEQYFEDAEIKTYYKKYKKLKNTQSSFMVYMTIKSDADFYHHYQLIQKESIQDTLSKAVFVSFSDKEDEKIAPKGHYSITASIHTDALFWTNKQSYKEQKERLHKRLSATICETLCIDQEQIVESFAATPNTFKRYINRSQLGGNPITMKNFLPKLPSNDTPIQGLYHVGDSVYAAQGWPGVMMGVNNLKGLLHV